MPYKTSVFIEHPVTKESHSVAEWAQILGVKEGTLRVRLTLHRQGKIDALALLSSSKRQGANVASVDTKHSMRLESFVFRPDVVLNGETVAYAAYRSTDLIKPVMTDIIPSWGGFTWNCYDIGSYISKNDLVRFYLNNVPKIRKAFGDAN